MAEEAKEMSVQVPNIFDYATSELSQDAFICWLIKLADIEGHELQAASKEFIALLCQIGSDDKKVKACDIGKLLNQNPKRQYPLQQYGAPKYGKMDVFFIAEVKNKATCFILEDKVHSNPHSDQLRKYVEYVQIKHPDLPIVKVYFKTGYLFENDTKACESAKYGILDYKLIYNFLKSVETHDVIFKLYRDHIKINFSDKFNEGLSAIERNNGHLFLHRDFVQYEFLKKLSLACQETIGEKRAVKTGTSFGDPWAEYNFIVNKDFFAVGRNEYFTYRVEPRKSREKDKGKRKRIYCLSVRHYAELKDAQQKKIKLERLNKYKTVFKEISGRIDKLSFSKPLNDHTGSNSSEISLLFFDDNKNSIQNVLEYLPAIHKEFISKYQQINDANCQNQLQSGC